MPTRHFAALALATSALIALGTLAAPAASADPPPLPEPPVGQLGVDSLFPLRGDPVIPCLQHDVRTAWGLASYIMYRCSSKRIQTQELPSALIPERVISNWAPNCAATPDKPAFAVNTGIWYGAVASNGRSWSTGWAETNTTETSGGLSFSHKGLSAEAKVSYSHSWQDNGSRTTAVEEAFSKTYVINQTLTTLVPPYHHAFFTYKPSYIRVDTLWTWQLPPYTHTQSAVDTVLVPKVLEGGGLVGEAQPQYVKMTPAEVRECQLYGKLATSPNAPNLNDQLVPGGTGDLEKWPFVYSSSLVGAPVMRGVTNFDYPGSDALERVKDWKPTIPQVITGDGVSASATDSLTMSAPAKVGFWVGGACTRFTATVSYDTRMQHSSAADDFIVFAAHEKDGELVVDSVLDHQRVPNPDLSAGVDPKAARATFDVPLPPGVDILLLEAKQRDGGLTRPAPTLLSKERNTLVVVNPEVSCIANRATAGTNPLLVSSHTAPVVETEVDLAPTPAQGTQGSAFFGVPLVGGDFSCSKENRAQNHVGLSCSGTPLTIRGQQFATGLGVAVQDSPGSNTVTWTNKVTTGKYIATCDWFSFRAAFDDADPAEKRSKTKIEVWIDGELKDTVTLFPQNTQTFDPHMVSLGGWGEHTIGLRIHPVEGGVKDRVSVDIIDPKLKCVYQALSKDDPAAPAPKPDSQPVPVSTPAPAPAPKLPDSAPNSEPDPAPVPERPLTIVSNVSDLTWTSELVSHGPIERDLSLGGPERGDGTPIGIGGASYAKGVGMHSGNSIEVDLRGTCTTFTSDVGVDDDAGDNGSVAFQVWADGALVADSGIKRGTDAAASLTADVTGKHKLVLSVTDAADGAEWDHASWGNPRLTCTG